MSDVKGFSGIGGRDLESGRFPTAQMFGLRLRLGPLGGEGGSGVIQHSGLGGDQRLPEAVVAKQGVGEHDELADDGGDRDLVRFAAVGQPLVEDAHVGVAAAGGSAGHVEHLARAGPPAADMASAAGCAAVAGERSRAGQGRGLLRADAAELGHVGAKHSRGNRTNPRDGAQDLCAASQGFVGFEGIGNGLVEHTDLALGSVVEAAECGRCGPGPEFGDALATVGPVLDTGCPGGGSDRFRLGSRNRR